MIVGKKLNKESLQKKKIVEVWKFQSHIKVKISNENKLIKDYFSYLKISLTGRY